MIGSRSAGPDVLRLFLGPAAVWVFAFFWSIHGAWAEPWLVVDDACGDNYTRVWAEAFGPVTYDALRSDEMPSSGTRVKVVESGRMAANRYAELQRWVEDGGTLLLSGVPTSANSCREGQPVSPERLLALAGLRAIGHDPGLLEAFPAVRRDSPALRPLASGDGLRLGQQGFGHALRLESDGAEIVATAYVLSGRDLHVRDYPHPALTVKKVGDGHVYFSSFSLGHIAACYPDTTGRATDCSAAASIESLMRLLLANLLWHHHGVQIPVPRQSPGTAATTVVITGDVHEDPADMQLLSAFEMARVAEEHGIPVTYFVVGDVALDSPERYSELASRPNVSVGTHSARGQQYRLGYSSIPGRRRGGVHGADPVCNDVQTAEAMLDLPHWPQSRPWPSAIRTEAWGSNELESEAWTGMHCASVSLVLDHSADAITSHPAITPPSIWFDRPVRKRLILPSFTQAAHTANDDFRTGSMGLEGIYSLASLQPDPCCNMAVPFSRYTDYVLDWHHHLQRVGSVLGVTQVWLWHPATPAARRAFPEIERIFESMLEGGDVAFATADALAAWNFNRQQLQLRAALGPEGRLQTLTHDGSMRPSTAVPAGSASVMGEISYWVHGEVVEISGWERHVRQIPGGDPITILSAYIEGFE